MGRYSSDPQTVQTNTNPSGGMVVTSNPYCNPPIGMQQGQPQQQNPMANWPTVFPKPVVGLDLHGTLIEYNPNINSPADIVPIPGALEAVRLLRLKGHKVFILADYPGIAEKKLTQQDADNIHNALMNLLGQAGCFSIDGLLYNTSAMKDDMYAKPNTGMMKRSTNEFKMNWKEGWYVGDDISDLKMAQSGGSKPILVMTGRGNETLPKLDSFANKELKKKVKIFPNLLSFAQSL